MKWIRIINRVSVVLLGNSIVRKSEGINTFPITEIKSLYYSEVENQFDLTINNNYPGLNYNGMVYGPPKVPEYEAKFTIESNIPQKFTTNNKQEGEDFRKLRDEIEKFISRTNYLGEALDLVETDSILTVIFEKKEYPDRKRSTDDRVFDKVYIDRPENA